MSKKIKTENCLCDTTVVGPCDRCGEGEVTKPAICPEDHIQYICGMPKVPCEKCVNEGWVSSHGDGGGGGWSNHKEEAQAALNKQAREILFQIMEDYCNLTLGEFAESMENARKLCKKQGFY